MSSYRKLAGHFWPWNTLGAAHQEWQTQESRLTKVRQQLALEYQAAYRQAEQLEIETDQGVLRAARGRLDQPHDPLILKGRNRLTRMFALRGKGFFRRVPSILAAELSLHVANIEEICRSQDDLAGRLRLARAIMDLFCRSPEFCSPPFLRLTIISPESASLLFQLRQKRLRDCQAIRESSL
ncbi:MAG: hypothetical protein M1438_04340 [Deltaproteobacteria bacterium]|nr:hypothetical protein [Deltaproteobacteria bacterium]